MRGRVGGIKYWVGGMTGKVGGIKYWDGGMRGAVKVWGRGYERLGRGYERIYYCCNLITTIAMLCYTKYVFFRPEQ